MKVTDFSKKLATSVPELAKWESEFPDQTIRFRNHGKFYGDCLVSGERFHHAFSRFAAGLWVPRVQHGVCLAIEGVLADYDVAEIESEVPVQGFGLRGQVDVVGALDSGRPVVIELKTTLGEYALKPRPEEVMQLGTYAAMLGHQNPLLLWLRVSLKSRCISVFKMNESDRLLVGIRGCLPSPNTQKAA